MHVSCMRSDGRSADTDSQNRGARVSGVDLGGSTKFWGAREKTFSRHAEQRASPGREQWHEVATEYWRTYLLLNALCSKAKMWIAAPGKTRGMHWRCLSAIVTGRVNRRAASDDLGAHNDRYLVCRLCAQHTCARDVGALEQARTSHQQDFVGLCTPSLSEPKGLPNPATCQIKRATETRRPRSRLFRQHRPAADIWRAKPTDLPKLCARRHRARMILN
jgi:hypothetical protein